MASRQLKGTDDPEKGTPHPERRLFRRLPPLGPNITAAHHFGLLEHVLSSDPEGTAVEFGVGTGQSTRLIAERMPVVGFDSFQGLPEFWRKGFPKRKVRRT